MCGRAVPFRSRTSGKVRGCASNWRHSLQKLNPSQPARQSLLPHIGRQSRKPDAYHFMSPNELWHFFPIGYLFSILIETPILLIGLSKRHPIKRRLFAGVWLTACTYPIVVLVLPLALAEVSRAKYLVIAEVFAPVAECVLFWLAYGESEQAGKASMWRDFGAIGIRN